MSITVHVTHEAIHKVGGIGAVLAGLVTSRAYQAGTSRTILVGPLADRHRAEPLGPDGTVVYDNWSGIWSDQAGAALYDVERHHGVRLVYGRRRFRCADGTEVEPEVLLVDVEGSAPHALGQFKYQLFQHMGLASDRYDSHWEYEQYVRLAEPAYDAVLALLADRGDTPVFFVAHEFMGLPTAFKAQLAAAPGIFTVFYAHEVATARRLVEQDGDGTFYGALRTAATSGQYVDDVFGPQDAYFKHALVRQAWRCDGVFAVGDLVVDELRFLGPEFDDVSIDRVYNGVPVGEAISTQARQQARERLASVVSGLLGWTPDFVFTHVGRLVPSKGMWRDLMVLEALEDSLRARQQSAVLLVLATEAGPRLAASVQQMRTEYGWPLVHREGYPDLSPGELALDLRVRAFNMRARQSRALFINQFGFDADSTGGAVPENVSFDDLRRGSDAEFGLSTYEPFGIAQIEPLAFGALSVVSDACGCVGFLQQVVDAGQPTVYVRGDYTRAQADAAGQLGCSASVAAALDACLPRNAAARQALLQAGQAAAAAMSWERVVQTQYLPALARIGAGG